ncbi:SAM-dependent methyltransferase [Streptomyces pinistramenti]|uniref:SAM-dependent methyltransferase n=1 Tax=Streptomyces pinistramenti TaxID=2884812 RepID=UPI001D0916A7|nr:class I SAM-dependent methyltransferase [Streptomyces pinistramenti]MCB5908196.1 methyltransferase domain-containing protein [Streptomyces pinistramenti]
MPHDSAPTSEDATRSYYDTADVDAFYDAVWGGEDIHTGIYAQEHEAIADASRRTVERAADKVTDLLAPGSTVLDLGSGYGGPARYLAERFGCRVIALNISEAQNKRHRTTNIERGLDGLVEVVTGSFQDIPYPDHRFDVVWSQEAFCHSGDLTQALSEAVRVLRPEGALVFTDLMAADGTPEEVLHPVVSRLGVDALATPDRYRRTLSGLGLSRIDFDDHSGQLAHHYVRLTEETHTREAELRDLISPGYVDRLLGNLPRWADAARHEQLRWGIFHCRRA